MNIRIAADSGCDISKEDLDALEVELVPLTLTIGEESFPDDEALDLDAFRKKMLVSKERTTSACPSPGSYLEVFLKSPETFCVTLSDKLSGSYESALLAKDMAEEKGCRVHVINSKTASAGEALIVLKLAELLASEPDFDAVRDKIEAFVSGVRTYFVLENLDILTKAGRLNKIAGKVITALNIRPIMGDDGNGSIAFKSYARSRKQILDKMAGFVRESGKDVNGATLVLAHNNNPELAESLRDVLSSQYPFKDIHIVPTRGIASLYSCDKGIVMAF